MKIMKFFLLAAIVCLVGFGCSSENLSPLESELTKGYWEMSSGRKAAYKFHSNHTFEYLKYNNIGSADFEDWFTPFKGTWTNVDEDNITLSYSDEFAIGGLKEMFNISIMNDKMVFTSSNGDSNAMTRKESTGNLSKLIGKTLRYEFDITSKGETIHAYIQLQLLKDKSATWECGTDKTLSTEVHNKFKYNGMWSTNFGEESIIFYWGEGNPAVHRSDMKPVWEMEYLKFSKENGKDIVEYDKELGNPVYFYIE